MFQEILYVSTTLIGIFLIIPIFHLTINTIYYDYDDKDNYEDILF